MANPVIDKYGNKRWYLNGKLHRVNGPASVSVDGYKAWYLNGNLHREDGPAVESVDGYKAWYLHGKNYSEELFRLIQFNNKICVIQ